MKTRCESRRRFTALLVIGPQECELRDSLVRDFETVGARILIAHSCEEARRCLENTTAVEVVLTDSSLPDGSWCRVLHDAEQINSRATVFVCARRDYRWLPHEVVQRGAYYVPVEPYHPLAVQLTVRAAVSRKEHERAA